MAQAIDVTEKPDRLEPLKTWLEIERIRLAIGNEKWTGSMGERATPAYWRHKDVWTSIPHAKIMVGMLEYAMGIAECARDGKEIDGDEAAYFLQHMDELLAVVRDME